MFLYEQIYCLKYCHITKNLIAVSELLAGSPAKAIADFHVGLFLCLCSFITFSGMTSSVGNGQCRVPYQIFRDFAENKGQFTPGTRIFSFTASRAIWSVNLIKPRD